MKKIKTNSFFVTIYEIKGKKIVKRKKRLTCISSNIKSKCIIKLRNNGQYN